MPKILGFAPDADPFTPGVLVDCDNLIPTQRGFKGSESPAPIGVSALSGECKGASRVIKLDASTRLLAGTDAALYEWSSGSWSDVSDTGGYTLGSEDGWQFEQFGNATIAAAKSETLQASTTGAFAAISGAPKAAHVAISNGFVVVANYDAGTDTPNGWHTSALRDHTDWTPSIATGSQNGLFVETPGPVRALKALSDYCIAYKERSIYVGSYIGPLWRWDLASAEFGAASPGCVVKTESAHIVMGRDDFYVFDGTRPVPIGQGVREWFFKTEIDREYLFRVQSLHDQSGKTVRWFYPSRASGGSLDRWIAYNYETQRWGKGALPVEVTVQWASGGLTIDDLATLSATIDGLPDIPYDSPFWTSSDEIPAVVNTSHVVQALQGDSTGLSITTGDVGADDSYTLIQRVRVRWMQKPTSATLTHYYRDDLDDDLVIGATVAESDGNFDFLWSSRWHRARITAVGGCEFSDVYVKAAPESDR